MKRQISTFLALFTLAVFLPARLFATAKDVNISQKNASDSAWTNVIIPPTANSLLAFNGSKTPISTVAPTGLTSMGVNIVSSAAGQPLTFQTGTFGTGLSFASATGAGTFVVAPTAPDYLLGPSGPSVSSSLASRAGAQGLAFSGGNGTLSVPLSSPFSLRFIANPDSISSVYGAIGVNGAAAGNVIFENGIPKINSTSGGYKSAVASASVGISDVWVYTHSGTTGTWYKNGVVTWTGADAGTYVDSIVAIGTDIGANKFFGTISGFTPYNRALSAAEVKALFETGGPSAADLPATPAGTALVTGDNSTFASDTGFWSKANGASIAGTCVLPNTGNISSPILAKGTAYRYSITLTTNTGTVRVYNGTSGGSSIVGTGTFIGEVSDGDVGNLYIHATVGNAVVTSFTWTPIGCLAAYSPHQPGRGRTMRDVSGHGADITWTTGVNWSIPDSSTISLGTNPALQATIAGDANGGVTVTPVAGQMVTTANAAGGGLRTGGITGALASDSYSTVGWMSDVAPLNPDGTNGALLISSRTNAAAEIVFATANTVRGRLSATGLSLAGTLGVTGAATISGSVTTASDQAFYIGDSATDGSWRFIRSANNLVVERRESGSWVNKGQWTP